MIYVASKTKWASLWQHLQEVHDVPIISTWIHEAGAKETNDMSELWLRIESEIRRSTGLLYYRKVEDTPHKGALIEVGMALMNKAPVVACMPGTELHGGPVGSWLHHPGVRREDDMRKALALLGVTP